MRRLRSVAEERAELVHIHQPIAVLIRVTHELRDVCGGELDVTIPTPTGEAKRDLWMRLKHYHFDHIEGLPFFPPLYDDQSVFTFYGFEPGRPIRQTLEEFIRPPYFPVALCTTPSKQEYVVAGPSFDLGPLRIASAVPHPVHHRDRCRRP